MKTGKRYIRTTFSYSVTSWMWHIVTMLLTLAIVAFILLKCYERTTIHLVTSLNKEFSLYVDNISEQVQSNIKQLGMQTFYSPATSKLRTSDSLTNFEFIEGIREMSACVTSSDLIYSIYVYNGKQNYIYTTKETGSFPLELFPDADAVKYFTQQTQNFRLKPVDREILRPDGEVDKRVYSFLLYETNDQPHFDNALMINVDFDDYNRNFFLADNTEYGILGELMLFNSDGELVATSTSYDNIYLESDLSSLAPVINNQQNDGYFINSSRGSKAIYMYSYMPNSQCYIARVIDYQLLMEGLTDIQNHFFFIVAVLAFAGLVLGLVTMHRFYRPLKRTVKSLLPRANQESVDIDSMMSHLDTLLENRDQEYQEYSSLLKQEYIKQLLTTQAFYDNPLAENLGRYGFNIPTHAPIRLLVCNKLPVSETLQTLRGIYPDLSVEATTISGYTFVLLSEERVTPLEQLGTSIIDLGSNFCGYSQPIAKMSELRKSYIHMTEVAKLSIFYSDKPLLPEAILKERQKENIYLSKAESRLLAALKNARQEGVVEAYNEFIQLTKHYRYNVIMFNFKRLYLVIRSLYMQNVEHTNDCKFTDTEYMDELFMAVKDFDVIHRIFYSIFDEIVESIVENEIEKNKALMEKAKLIVVEQFTDFNLTPSSIADQLGVTQSFLAKTFRVTEDISINDYINAVRIKRSRELLRDERNLTIKEITAMTGIENTQYFYTLFKKSTGLTPSLYRQLKSFDLEDQNKNQIPSEK